MHTNLFEILLIILFVLSMLCGAPSNQRSMTYLSKNAVEDEQENKDCWPGIFGKLCYISCNGFSLPKVLVPVNNSSNKTITDYTFNSCSLQRKEGNYWDKTEKCKNFLNFEPFCLHHWHVLTDWSRRCSYLWDHLLSTYHILNRNFGLLCYSSISWWDNSKCWGQIQWYTEASSFSELWSQLFLQHFSEKHFMLFLL